jgi:ribosomal protein S18 acetylase RimI-like enzyme
MIALHELNEHDWELWRTLRRAALADSPDAFGSTIAEWTGVGDVEARWRDRLVSVPFNVIAALDGSPSGMASGTTPQDGEVQLISMWVAPEARGRGIGDELIEAVVRWASHSRAEQIALDVRIGNDRAISLYRKNGFLDDGWANGPDAPHPERRMVRKLTSP